MKEASEKRNNTFISLGVIFLITGLVVLQNASIWPLGFIFLMVGLVGKSKSKKQN